MDKIKSQKVPQLECIGSEVTDVTSVMSKVADVKVDYFSGVSAASTHQYDMISSISFSNTWFRNAVNVKRSQRKMKY